MKPIISKRYNKKGLTFRIIVKYTDEYGKAASKETTYLPEKNVSEAKAEVYAEIFAEKYQDDLLMQVEEKKKKIELEKKTGGPFSQMTFKELAKEWLDSKFDMNDPMNPKNVSYTYYEKAVAMIKEYNKEFGDFRVVDINYDVIYKYYKKINNEKKIRIIVNAKPDIKETFKLYGLSFRKITSKFQKKSLDLHSICNGVNIQERTAKKVCDATGIPFKELFTKKVIEEPYAEYTKAGKKKFLKAIFSFAQNVLRIISENPAIDGVTKFTLPTKRRESLSEEQAIKFYEATKEFDIMIQTAMHLSLLTGMRPAEMGGLEWRDIDFSYKTLTVERNAIECSKFGTVIKGTKTNRARTISIPEVLVEQLLKYRKWQEEWKEQLGDYYKDDGQVFSHPDGSRITTDVFNKWFKKVRDKAGIPNNFTLYNLRHTNISILVGYVPISVVAQRAGHTTTKTTEEYYIHRVSEADMKASEKLNSVFEQSYLKQEKGQTEVEIEEYKQALEKMKLLGFKTLEEYFEYLNYMKLKGYTY